MEKLDERAFLCYIQSVDYDDILCRIIRVNVHLLGVCCGAEGLWRPQRGFFGDGHFVDVDVFGEFLELLLVDNLFGTERVFQFTLLFHLEVATHHDYAVWPWQFHLVE